jgi:NTE family protein
VTPWLQPSGTLEATSVYDTSALKETLQRLVDFDRLNAGMTRFSAGAVNVRTGNLVYFDNSTHDIRPEIEIEGELYWDGGLVSNTMDGRYRAAP